MNIQYSSPIFHIFSRAGSQVNSDVEEDNDKTRVFRSNVVNCMACWRRIENSGHVQVASAIQREDA